MSVADSLIGRQFGVYRVGSPIGRGGIGEVYEATHTRTGRKYAIKVLQDPDPQAVRRFQREAEALAAIGHPGVVGIHDFNQSEDGLTYLVMDKLEGEDLSARLERGALSQGEALARFSEVAGALSAAHRAGVLHRDLKPSNIFLMRADGFEERAVLLDFGLAKPVHDDRTKLTATGQTMGTPMYMSPEQALGEELDERSDVYSLGAVLYEMLCGLPPFDGPTLTAILSKVLTAPPQPLHLRGVNVPDDLNAAVSAALAKSPEDRPGSVSTFAALLGQETSEAAPAPVVAPGSARTQVTPKHVAPKTPPGTRTTNVPRQGGRWRWLVAAAIFLTGVGVLGTALLQGAGSEASTAEVLPPDEGPAEPALTDEQPVEGPSAENAASDDAAGDPRPEQPTSEQLAPEQLAEAPGGDLPAPEPVARPPERQARSNRPRTPQTSERLVAFEGQPPRRPPSNIAPLPDLQPHIDAANQQISLFEQGQRYLQRLVRQGRRASDVCPATFDLSSLPTSVQGYFRGIQSNRERMCLKWDEARTITPREQTDIDRLRGSFERHRRSISRRDEETLPAAERAELLARLGAVETAVQRNPFSCDVPAYDVLNRYARDLGPRAAQPALEVGRAIDRICRDNQHLPARERQYADALAGTEQSLAAVISSQEDVRAHYQSLTREMAAMRQQTQ